ncbi:cytosol aminopeptidase-like [Stegodyphus dumicola]|uniref:cytosol aminopeptidase-like n=1 Tax=Stegodyphus dumicola TaxID=202533 RepID=UPI0015AF9188|nr:cytosol aminopeptidase-like [Stegodyphus dumicola]
MNYKGKSVLLLGSYIDTRKSSKTFVLTENAKLWDISLKGALTTALTECEKSVAEEKVKIFHFEDPLTDEILKGFDRVAVAYLGPLCVPKGVENVDKRIDNLMRGISSALRLLTTRLFTDIYIESCGNPKIVGTAAALTLPDYFLLNRNLEPQIHIKYFDKNHQEGKREFEQGIILGNGQTLAQLLMKSTSLSDFISTVQTFLQKINVPVIKRDKNWIREKKMEALLSASVGSVEDPVILEIACKSLNAGVKPLILVSKATPYEHSSLALKNKPDLQEFPFKTSMGGASSLVGCLYSLCKLQVRVYVHCILVLVCQQQTEVVSRCENIICTMNGTTIQLDYPRPEGRLIMADALCYADTFDAAAIVDVTSIASYVDELIGNSYVAVFTRDDLLFKLIQQASCTSGEKIWRLPLYDCFNEFLKTTKSANICCVGESEKTAIACKLAAFLCEFVKSNDSWAHLDISAVCQCTGKKEYLNDWATGRSTRLLTEFCVEYFKKGGK